MGAFGYLRLARRPRRPRLRLGRSDVTLHTPGGTLTANTAKPTRSGDLGTDIYPGAASGKGSMRMTLPTGSMVSAVYRHWRLERPGPRLLQSQVRQRRLNLRLRRRHRPHRQQGRTGIRRRDHHQGIIGERRQDGDSHRAHNVQKAFLTPSLSASARDFANLNIMQSPARQALHRPVRPCSASLQSTAGSKASN